MLVLLKDMIFLTRKCHHLLKNRGKGEGSKSLTTQIPIEFTSFTRYF